MKRLTTLFMVMLLLFGFTETTLAFEPVNNLINSGKMSNDVIHHAILDTSNVINNSVITYVYKGNNEQLTINHYNNITSQTPSSAADKLTRFVFELTNNYRPDTDLGIGFSNDLCTVNVYIYGTHKSQVMDAVIIGLPDCLNHAHYDAFLGTEGDGIDDSWINAYYPDNWLARYRSSDDSNGSSNNNSSSSIPDQANKLLQSTAPVKAENQMTKSAVFTPDSQTYMVNGETRQMDVKPYLKDGLIYVPVRFLAYSLNVPDNGIQWDQADITVTIVKDDITLVLTIGSNTMLVNGKPVIIDIVPEIKDSRTMLPARYIVEAFGGLVEWDNENNQTIIKMPEAGD